MNKAAKPPLAAKLVDAQKNAQRGEHFSAQLADTARVLAAVILMWLAATPPALAEAA